MRERGQASIEIILLMVVIIALVTFIILRYAEQQSSIFVTSAARQAFIGEAGSIKETIYLERVDALECENAFRVFVYAQPEPSPAAEAQLSDAIEAEAGAAIRNSKEVDVYINNSDAGLLQC